VSAFRSVFGDVVRPYGTEQSRWQGVSDGARGVQWNAGVDREEGTVSLGVNLEGMEYDAWPVARLIERELARPTLLDVASQCPVTNDILLEWSRDAWQATARLPISEREIGATPVHLSALNPDAWRTMLGEAYNCLDPNRNHRGRAKQWVTLPTKGRVEKTVSPHLHLRRVMCRRTPPSQTDAQRMMVDHREALTPIYRWMAHQSRA
jgi:hypothetical protein